MRVGLSSYLLHGGADYRSAGVSTYTRLLLEHLPAAGPNHAYVAFHGPDAPSLQGIRSVVAPVPTERPLVRIPWEQLALPVLLSRHAVHIVHGTVNVVPLLTRTPSVVTVHDLSFLRHPERFRAPKAWYLQEAVKLSAHRAARVIAISRSTERDVLELLGVPRDKVSVIYQGVHARFRPMPARNQDERLGGRPYILHVGTLEPRKNIDVLIRAYAALRAGSGVPHVLVLVGARGWMYDDLFRLVDVLGLREDVRFVDYVRPEDLPLWYNGADLFACPSAYEGFGLPLVEAMACGVPCVSSTGGALAEVAGEACVTVRPGSEEALQEAMDRTLSDGALRARLRELGPRQASRFSWTAAARETVAIYEKVAAS